MRLMGTLFIDEGEPIVADVNPLNNERWPVVLHIGTLAVYLTRSQVAKIATVLYEELASKQAASS